jgi:hypothetical protein
LRACFISLPRAGFCLLDREDPGNSSFSNRRARPEHGIQQFGAIVALLHLNDVSRPSFNALQLAGSNCR